MKIAAFVDRDGTLIEDTGYLSDPSQIKLFPGAAEGIAMLNAEGILVVLVTNQSGVARGMFPEERVSEVNKTLLDMLSAQGAVIDAVYYCPHHPTVGDLQYRIDCDCRKPQPGLVLRAAKELNIDVASSFVVGDMDSDVELAANAGCAAAVLVLTGYGQNQDTRVKTISPSPKRIHIARDFLSATKWLLEQVHRNPEISTPHES